VIYCVHTRRSTLPGLVLAPATRILQSWKTPGIASCSMGSLRRLRWSAQVLRTYQDLRGATAASSMPLPPGTYQFSLTSDDGSLLYLDGSPTPLITDGTDQDDYTGFGFDRCGKRTGTGHTAWCPCHLRPSKPAFCLNTTRGLCSSVASYAPACS